MVVTMDKNEPALVPQWLKGVTGNSHPNNAESSPYADRTSCYRRSVSSNGLGVERDNNTQSLQYSNFGRNNRNRDYRRDVGYHENERPLKVDNGYHDFAKSPKADRSDRSPSWHLKRLNDSREPSLMNNMPGNRPSGGSPRGISGGGGIRKTSFERDFPLLLAEERQVDASHVSTPRFNPTSHVGSSISNDVWASALVDIPPSVGGSVPVALAAQQSLIPGTQIASGNSNTGLNMAETLAKAPSRPQSAPQLDPETQKLEELAIRQSKQLIPVTPSTPKASITNLAERSKLKPRLGEVGVPAKSSLAGNHSRGIAKTDLLKPSQVGNFQVLNREKNGISPLVKDVTTSNTCRTPAVLGSIPSTLVSPRNPSQQKTKIDSKARALPVLPVNIAEKKTALQAKDRNDFFNSLRKKKNTNLPTLVEQTPVSHPDPRTPDEQYSVAVSSDTRVENSLSDTNFSSSVPVDSADDGNTNACGAETGERDMVDVVDLTEEEKKFLTSLGWDENMGCMPLTAEEIDAFLKKHNLVPSKTLNGEKQQPSQPGSANSKKGAC